MSYVTVCRACDEDEVLELIFCECYPAGVTIEEDGFSLSDAKQLDTSRERVRCSSCGHVDELRQDDDKGG